jgi:hypothetical protein
MICQSSLFKYSDNEYSYLSISNGYHSICYYIDHRFVFNYVLETHLLVYFSKFSEFLSEKIGIKLPKENLTTQHILQDTNIEYLKDIINKHDLSTFKTNIFHEFVNRIYSLKFID